MDRDDTVYRTNVRPRALENDAALEARTVTGPLRAADVSQTMYRNSYSPG